MAAAPNPSLQRHLPGLLLCLALALVAIRLGRLPWMASHGLGALTVAIILGMAIGHMLPAHWRAGANPGIVLSKQLLLKAGIVLYGVKLTLHDIGLVGSAGVLIDALMLCSTFMLAWVVGTRLLGIDRHTTMLIGAGSSICGAAAVLATEPVLRADSDKVAVAISTVVVFGTLAIFLYPALYQYGLFNTLLSGSTHAFGVYEGSTIHEVAQVVAAAQGLGAQATDSAVIAKMVRVMMLAPFLLVLSAVLARARRVAAQAKADASTRLALPWFAFLFIGVVLVNSFLHWKPAAMSLVNDSDLLFLGMAMAALGQSTHIAAIRRAGLKPLLLAAVLWLWLVAGGAAINGAITRMF